MDKKILMRKLGLVNDFLLTNAGKALFSKNRPIILKMAVFATEHKNTFLDISRVEGNIFQLIDAATSYIIKNIRWSSKISDDGIHRVETPEIPIDAIREAVINSFAHARYDSGVQHEIDVFSNRISIINPGSFANDFRPEDFANRDLHSFLRNEQISKTLYLCKDVETFGSGLRKIYSLCDSANVKVSYIDSETDFTIEFSRIDRNNMPDDGIINDVINGTLSEFEAEIFRLLKNNKNLTVSEIVGICGKSVRTVNRAIASLKSKKLIERIGSNKTGYWKTN
jgi:ATP-dependent DNA helicase RecG